MLTLFEILLHCSNNLVSSLKEFYGKPAYNEKHLRTKIKSYEDTINEIFHNDTMQWKDSHCTFLSVILIDSVFKVSKNYYSQVL